MQQIHGFTAARPYISIGDHTSKWRTITPIIAYTVFRLDSIRCYGAFSFIVLLISFRACECSKRPDCMRVCEQCLRFLFLLLFFILRCCCSRVINALHDVQHQLHASRKMEHACVHVGKIYANLYERARASVLIATNFDYVQIWFLFCCFYFHSITVGVPPQHKLGVRCCWLEFFVVVVFLLTFQLLRLTLKWCEYNSDSV